LKHGALAHGVPTLIYWMKVSGEKRKKKSADHIYFKMLEIVSIFFLKKGIYCREHERKSKHITKF
jgi:hypothetical protein